MGKKIYHIVAVAENGVIGKGNHLPWPKITGDLKHFKAMTTGGTVIMGRKTFDSIGKPLPNRENMVLSRSFTDFPKGVQACKSVKKAIDDARTSNIFIIGGAEIYRQTLEDIHGIYLTKIHAAFDGDTFYPLIPATFKLESTSPLESAPGDPKLEVLFYKNTLKS